MQFLGVNINLGKEINNIHENLSQADESRNTLKTEISLARDDIASLKATFSGMKLRNELSEKTRLKNMNELTAKIHRRFVVLERKMSVQLRVQN